MRANGTSQHAHKDLVKEINALKVQLKKLSSALETEANMRERLSITTVAAIMNRVPNPLFNTADLAALSPLGSHARLAVRRNAAAEVALAMVRRLAEAGIATRMLPMMFTSAMGIHELEQLGQVLTVDLIDR